MPPAAETAIRAGARNGAPGNRPHPRRAPRPRRRGRWIAGARRRRSASATAAKGSNGRRRGSRFFSWRARLWRGKTMEGQDYGGTRLMCRVSPYLTRNSAWNRGLSDWLGESDFASLNPFFEPGGEPAVLDLGNLAERAASCSGGPRNACDRSRGLSQG